MKLALFFTCHISLKLWVDTGLFFREKLLYEQHLRRGNLEKVYWLTYGRNDRVMERQLKDEGRLHPDIIVLPMPRIFVGKLGRLLYSLIMPLIHRCSIKNAHILKTNQMFGSWSAVIAKWLYKKPLIIRSGYTFSKNFKKQKKSKLKIIICESIERFAYQHADVGIVSSKNDKRYICAKYVIPEEKIKVLYNYIDTSRFHPISCEKYRDRIIFVGRQNAEKNLFNLIEAVSKCNLTLDIYGKSEPGYNLDTHAKKLNARVNFMGVVSNNKLPAIYNRYYYYILPSLYEGMPKSLLEAMACGLICIGTNVEGINEIIKDEVNGYLADGIDIDNIAKAINNAMRFSNESISASGMKKIQDECSLTKTINEENGFFLTLTK